MCAASSRLFDAIPSANKALPSWLPPVMLALIAFLCHGRAVLGDLVNFDTRWFLFRTPIQHGLTASNLVWAFGTDTPGGWSPLTWLSHMTMISLVDGQPGPHLLVNVLLHVGNVVLLERLLGRMTGKRYCSALTALFFAVHPLHVEAVAWVAERSIVLAMFFGLLTLMAYRRYAARPNAMRYVAVLLLFALSLLAKPMVVTLPLVMLLLDYWPLRRTVWLRSEDRAAASASLTRLVMEKAPLLALSVVSSIFTVIVQKNVGGLTTLQKTTLPQRVTNAVVAYVDYPGMMFNPTNLSCFYPYNYLLPWWRVVSAVVLLVCVSWIVFKRRADMPWLPVGWFWYLGTFVPMIGLVHTGIQSMADRYAYLPMIGVYVMVVFTVARLVERSWLTRRDVVVAAVAVYATLGVLCVMQVGYWRDSVALFKHSLDVTSDNFLAHNNFGAALLLREGPEDWEAACEHFRRAMVIMPGYTSAQLNLARTLMHMGQREQAIGMYQLALGQNPRSAMARADLGVAHADVGDHEEAIEWYRRALEIEPDVAQVRYNLAMSLLAIGDHEAAAIQFERAVVLDPMAPQAWFDFGGLRHQQGDLEGAESCYRHALEIDSDDITARYRLGQVLLARRDPVAAAKQFEQLVALDANHAGAHHFLGLARAAMGLLPEAVTSYERAIQLRPDWPKALNDLGVALARLGRMDDAANCFEEAVSLDPEYEDARVNLRKARQ